MMCRITREGLEVSGATPSQVKGQATLRRVKANGRMVDRLFWDIGAIIDHPEAYYLVKQGIAMPHDDECREAAGMTPEALAAASRAFERTAAGIAPDDFAAFDAGYLRGYGDDGEWLPGPNGGYEEYRLAIGEYEEEDEE